MTLRTPSPATLKEVFTLAASFVQFARGPVFEGDGLKMKIGTLNLGTYATGGVAVVASDFGLETLEHLFICVDNQTALKFAKHDRPNGKVIAYTGVYATEVGDTTDLSAAVNHLFVIAVGR